MANFSDTQVVSAFNACFDIKKWYKMPAKVRNRFDELLKHHRLGFVCFSPTSGRESIKIRDTSVEMVTRLLNMQINSTDLVGQWVECPPKELVVPVPHIIMSANGDYYFDENDRNKWCCKGICIRVFEQRRSRKVHIGQLP